MGAYGVVLRAHRAGQYRVILLRNVRRIGITGQSEARLTICPRSVWLDTWEERINFFRYGKRSCADAEPARMTPAAAAIDARRLDFMALAPPSFDVKQQHDQGYERRVPR